MQHTWLNLSPLLIIASNALFTWVPEAQSSQKPTSTCWWSPCNSDCWRITWEATYWGAEKNVAASYKPQITEESLWPENKNEIVIKNKYIAALNTCDAFLSLAHLCGGYSPFLVESPLCKNTPVHFWTYFSWVLQSTRYYQRVPHPALLIRGFPLPPPKKSVVSPTVSYLVIVGISYMKHKYSEWHSDMCSIQQRVKAPLRVQGRHFQNTPKAVKWARTCREIFCSLHSRTFSFLVKMVIAAVTKKPWS